MENVFSIEFPILVTGDGVSDMGYVGYTATNYYTSGAQRETRCCGCDKD